MDTNTRKILEIFQQINTIPRCSKREEKITVWLEQWASTRGFRVKKDAAGNLLINVPSTVGYDHAPVIVIQGHMDMVCEKSPDSSHDFTTDPIGLKYDGDWLRAKNTTLGADNGIAIAIALALAGDKSVIHPPLELLFTVDEESGLNGAKQIESGFIEGNVLLNVDSETEGVFTIGCAGGRNTLISRKLTFNDLAEDSQFLSLTIQGLHGGHSGIDIHKQRANANKILARTMHQLGAVCDVRLVSINGGSAHNVIPRNAQAVFACDPSDTEALFNTVNEFERIVKTEYDAVDPSLSVSLSRADSGPQGNTVLDVQETLIVIGLLLSLPHGVMGMSPILKDLVETSNNLSTVEIKDATLQILTSQRSSVMSRMNEVTTVINSIATLAGAETKSDSEFSPWSPNLQSALLRRCKEIYRQVFNQEAEVESIHAGLECAIIGDTYPGMEMISFGPTIKDPHSPNERLFIPSIVRVWDFMVALLKSYGQ
ncbi:MAG: aminoacyl-histidine dipeptidase [Desulfobacterales bacterium]|jgi:dipeptidase D